MEATGDGLRFQWQKNCSDIDDRGTRYRGTHTNTLRILEAEKCDEGHYRCRVMNNKERVTYEAPLTFGELVYSHIQLYVCVCLKSFTSHKHDQSANSETMK